MQKHSKKTNQFKTLDDLGKKLRKNPEFVRQYEALETWSLAVDELIRLREAQGLTQKELAQRLKTAQPAIARLESGKYNPTIKFLDSLARALGKRLEIRFV